MEEELYISLLQKKRSGPLAADEQSELDDWLARSSDNLLIAKQIEQVWALSGGFSQPIELDADADFAKLEQRIAEAEAGRTAKLVPMRRPGRRWLAIAAAVLLLVTAPLLLRKYLAPAAVLETASTADAPIAQPIQLADGSKVWLNSRSSLKHFTTNEGDERRVELSGEAFFEVAKNPERPFVVHTPLGEVTVLGTSFNVNATDGEILEVNVSTGRVRLQPTNASQALVLTADETGIFDKTKNSLVKSGGPANNSAAWHTGKLVFDNTPLKVAVQQLSALHGINLLIENEEVRLCTLTVTFDHEPLETTLQTLGTMFGAKVMKVAEKEYRMTGGRCGQ